MNFHMMFLLDWVSRADEPPMGQVLRSIFYGKRASSVPKNH
jgi:hypothetical protein